ncbi:MAG: RHS repeat-associated core domain-containing protein, partial [Bacteroidales bacterium]|nr:RHS repeat-associated core domain-containing protein [Bacteroidales bacterium]
GDNDDEEGDGGDMDGIPPGGMQEAPGINFTLTARGFTGHEHYPELKIINMNGRLYDPVIGRFFSPDTYVQNPGFTQSFNRYSYCLNNPLKYVDPSGEFFALLGILNSLQTMAAIFNSSMFSDLGNAFNDFHPDDPPGKDFFSFSVPPETMLFGGTLPPLDATAPSNFRPISPLNPGIPRGALNSTGGVAFGIPGMSTTSIPTYRAPAHSPYTPSPHQQDMLASQFAFRSQTPAWGPSANFLGHLEFGYNMAVEGSLNASNFARGFGVGLTGLNIIADVNQMRKQYKNEKHIDPVTATNTGANFVGLVSKFASKFPFAARYASFVGRAAGFVGTAITTAQSWWQIYKSMDDLRFAPLSIDHSTGEPYFGDPFDEYYYYKSMGEMR